MSESTYPMKVCAICSKSSNFAIRVSLNLPEVMAGEDWVCIDCLRKNMEQSDF